MPCVPQSQPAETLIFLLTLPSLVPSGVFCTFIEDSLRLSSDYLFYHYSTLTITITIICFISTITITMTTCITKVIGYHVYIKP